MTGMTWSKRIWKERSCERLHLCITLKYQTWVRQRLLWLVDAKSHHEERGLDYIGLESCNSGNLCRLTRETGVKCGKACQGSNDGESVFVLSYYRDLPRPRSRLKVNKYQISTEVPTPIFPTFFRSNILNIIRVAIQPLSRYLYLLLPIVFYFP